MNNECSLYKVKQCMHSWPVFNRNLFSFVVIGDVTDGIPIFDSSMRGLHIIFRLRNSELNVRRSVSARDPLL